MDSSPPGSSVHWGCALPSPNAPGKAPNHIHTTVRWGRAPGKPSLAGACWASLKASVHSSRLPFDEAGWRKFHVKPARANGLRLEGRLTSRAKHPSHPGWWGWGDGIPQNKGACFPSPKALEGTAISWALCGPSVPNLAPLPPQLWHAFRTVLLFIMPGS